MFVRSVLRRSFATSTVPSVQIKIHHHGNASTPAPSSHLNFHIKPTWEERYELTNDSSSTIETTGDIDTAQRQLKLDVHIPADAEQTDIMLALPQRCHVTLMGSRTLNLEHQISVGGGTGRLEGDLKIFIPHGDINVHKSRGEQVELRTANGSVHIKSVLEGLTADISSTQGFTAKRVMGENVTVRVSGSGSGSGHVGQGPDQDQEGSRDSNDGEECTTQANAIHIAAMYGGQFFLQSPQGSINVDTAQVQTLDARSGGKGGIRVGGMSGNILAHAADTNSTESTPSTEQSTADVHVSFDQLIPVRPAKETTDPDQPDQPDQPYQPERSMIKADGTVHIALNDETPFAVRVDLKSQVGEIQLPLDYSADGSPELGRQASTSQVKTALFDDEDTEGQYANDSGRVIGLLRSAPKKKSRASNSGGSGKISMDAGSDLLGMSGEDKNGRLTVMAEGLVHVAIHGWMDRIRSKYFGEEESGGMEGGRRRNV